MKETYSRTKSVWQRMDETERKAVMDYGEKYKAFLDTARTERLAAKEIIRQAEAKGFKPVYDMKSLKAGDKVYWNQKDKSVILAVIGEEPVHPPWLPMHHRNLGMGRLAETQPFGGASGGC